MAALIVAAGFLASRVAGLLRSVIIAHSFGTSPDLDAYWVAFRLPDLVFQLLAGATLASAFIPTFATLRRSEGEEASWRLASSVLNLVLIATIVLAAAAFVAAPILVPMLAPGLGSESGREAELQNLAVKLTRIMLISPILFAVSGMFMGILNARRHFLTPALAPVLYNFSIIAAALVSQDVNVLATGVVTGAALHLLIQLPDLRTAGMRYYLVAAWRDTAVREVGRLMAPRVLGLAATQVNFYFVAIFFASRMQDGAISAVNFAWLIVMTPLGVIGMAIATAAFPTLAQQAAAAEREQFTATLLRTLRMILFLSLPAGLGLALLARPLVVVLLQRGQFDVASSELTAQALSFYAFALFAHASIEILSRGFYALSDTRTPVLVAVGAMLINLGFAILLSDALDLRGLALALSLATMAEVAGLYYLLARRIPDLRSDVYVHSLLNLVPAAALMTCAVSGALIVLLNFTDVDWTGSNGAILVLVICSSLGAAIYLAGVYLAGGEEPRLLLQRFRRRISKGAVTGS